jgi:hypothetical protein
MDGLRPSLAPYISNRVVGWPAVKGHESASRTARSAPLTAGRAPTRTIVCRERGNQRGCLKRSPRLKVTVIVSVGVAGSFVSTVNVPTAPVHSGASARATTVFPRRPVNGLVPYTTRGFASWGNIGTIVLATRRQPLAESLN